MRRLDRSRPQRLVRLATRIAFVLASVVAMAIAAQSATPDRAVAQELDCRDVAYNQTIVTVCRSDDDGDDGGSPAPTHTPVPTVTPEPGDDRGEQSDDADDGDAGADPDEESEDDERDTPDRGDRGARVGEDDPAPRFDDDADEDPVDADDDPNADDDPTGYADRDRDDADDAIDEGPADGGNTTGDEGAVDVGDFVAEVDPPPAGWPVVAGLAAMSGVGGVCFLAARRMRSEPLEFD